MEAFWIVLSIIFGAVCAAVASSKGRSAVVWFLLGFLFGWIALIIIACLSNVKEEQSYRDRQSRENRRLREQLRQERIKGEAFRQHTQMRLDMHDHQLGVSTRATYNALPGQQQQPALLEGGGGGSFEDFEIGQPQQQPHQQQTHQQQTAGFGEQQGGGDFADAGGVTGGAGGATGGGVGGNHQQARPGSNRQWHYESSGQVIGPITEHQMLEMLRTGQISGATLLWTEDLGDWKAANQIRALQQYITS